MNEVYTVKIRKLPKEISYCLLVSAILFVVLIFTSGGLHLVFEKMFMASWIVLAVFIVIGTTSEWFKSAKWLYQKKLYIRLILHIAILFLVLWVCSAIVWGLAKGIMK